MSANLTRGSEKLTLGNASRARRSTRRVPVQPSSGSLKKHSSRVPERSASVTPSPSRSTQPHLGVLQVEAGRLAVALERAPIPQAVEPQREIAGQRRGDDQQVGAAVAVRVEQLHARVAELRGRRARSHLARQIEAAVAQVAPVAHGAVHLEDVGQAVAEQVDQLEVGLASERPAGRRLARGRTSRRSGSNRV